MQFLAGQSFKKGKKSEDKVDQLWIRGESPWKEELKKEEKESADEFRDSWSEEQHT
jgi:hypothetical protein